MSKTIEVSDETYELIKHQLQEKKQIDISDISDFVGKKLFIRTVTYHMVGKVEKVIGKILQLSTASWVADSGRFMNAIKEGTLSEVEPVGTWFVNLEATTDFGIWNHSLPTEQQ